MTRLREQVAAILRASDEPWYVSALLWIAIGCVAAMFWAAFS